MHGQLFPVPHYATIEIVDTSLGKATSVVAVGDVTGKDNRDRESSYAFETLNLHDAAICALRAYYGPAQFLMQVVYNPMGGVGAGWCDLAAQLVLHRVLQRSVKLYKVVAIACFLSRPQSFTHFSHRDTCTGASLQLVCSCVLMFCAHCTCYAYVTVRPILYTRFTVFLEYVCILFC